MSGECIIIAGYETDVNERLLLSDSVSKTCCKRQYIRYKGSNYFYYDFYSHISDMKNFSYYEILSSTVLKLQAQLKDINYNVNIVPCFYKSQNEFLHKLLLKKPEAAVIQLDYSNNIAPFIRITKYIKELSPNTKIIVSGQYIFNKFFSSSIDDWNDLMSIIGADFYVYQNASDSIIKILLYLKNASCLSLLSYIFMKDKNNYKLINNSSVPLKIKNKLELTEKYYNEGIVNFSTSTGCPAKCSFCNFPLKNSQRTYMKLSEVKEAFDTFKSLGIKTIVFSDDTFNLPTSRFKDILNMLIDGEYKFEWYCYFRIKECDEKIVELMSASGCKGVFLGIESANNCMLENMNKQMTLNDVKKGLKYLKKYNILIMAFFMVGFPGETKESIEQTINFINKSQIDFYTINLWYADESTKIFDKKNDFLLEGKAFKWKHSTMDSITATNFINKMITQINKTWVPNENFGFQSIPYMLSLGFSLNNVIKILELSKELMLNNFNELDETIRENTIGKLKQIIDGGKNENI